jgi:hypothetical protein
MGEPIPFGSAQKSGFDEETGAGPAAFNVFTDARGAVRRRPGITTIADAPTGVVDARGIEGVFCTDDGFILAVSGGEFPPLRNIYEVSGGTARRLLGAVPGTGRPHFAQTDMLVAIASRGQPIKYERAARTIGYLGGSPPQGSHIATGAQRLVLNDVVDSPSIIRFSATAQGKITYAGHEQWTLTNPVTSGQLGADRRPDPIVALADSTNEIFAWGTYSLQIFSPDPQFGFAPSATVEYGCTAPESVIKADDSFMWMDQYRRFILSNGRSRDDISADIAGQLETFPTVSDCFGYRVIVGNLDAVLWTFPSAGVTYAYQKSIGWSQWSGFSAGNMSAFPVSAMHYRPSDGANIVGTTDGKIGQLSLTSSTDLGEAIVARSTTGYLDRGTDARKNCKVVRLALRRGRATGASGPNGFLCWRDRPGPWQGRVPVDLGGSKDTEIVVELRSLGVYRRRQWMFEFSGTEELVLARASEEFQVLGQ